MARAESPTKQAQIKQVVANIITYRTLIAQSLLANPELSDWLDSAPGSNFKDSVTRFNDGFTAVSSQCDCMREFLNAILGYTPISSLQHSDSVRPSLGIVHFQKPGEAKGAILASPQKKQHDSKQQLITMLGQEKNNPVLAFLLEHLDDLRDAASNFEAFFNNQPHRQAARARTATPSTQGTDVLTQEEEQDEDPAQSPPAKLRRLERQPQHEWVRLGFAICAADIAEKIKNAVQIAESRRASGKLLRHLTAPGSSATYAVPRTAAQATHQSAPPSLTLKTPSSH